MNLCHGKGRELNEYEAAAQRLKARLGDKFTGEDIAWEVRRARWESQFREVLIGSRRPPEHPDNIRSVHIKRVCGLLGDDREYVREMMVREYEAWLEFAGRHAQHLLPANQSAQSCPHREEAQAKPPAMTEPSGVTWFK